MDIYFACVTLLAGLETKSMPFFVPFFHVTALWRSYSMADTLLGAGESSSKSRGIFSGTATLLE